MIVLHASVRTRRCDYCGRDTADGLSPCPTCHALAAGPRVAGLSPRQRLVLALLARVPAGADRPGELAARLGTTRPRVMLTLAYLQTRGLVDGSGHLTPGGRAMLDIDSAKMDAESGREPTR